MKNAGAKRLAENCLISVESLIDNKCSVEAAVTLEQYKNFSTLAGTYNEDLYLQLGTSVIAISDEKK